MLSTTWTSVGSILFGLIGLIVPIIGLYSKIKPSKKRECIFTALSLCSCAISLCIQIFYTVIMVRREDWSGLMDTMNTVASVSIALLITTILFNVIFIATCNTKIEQ